MLETKLIGIGVLLTLATTNADAAPAWCQTAGLERPIHAGTVADALTNKDPRRALPDLVTHTCWPDDEAQKRMKELDGARARWSKAMMLTEADWVDVATWAMGQQSKRNEDEFPLEPDKKYALSTLGPVDQFAAIVRGLPNSRNQYSEYTYLTDALGTRLTEAGRLGYLLQACLRPNNYGATVVEWATCTPDLALFDRKKLADELRADRARGGHEKMVVRIQAFFLDDKVKVMTEKWKAAKAKDPAYEKMFEIALKTRKEWDQLWTTERAALDLMLAMDDARETSSRKLREGCEAKVWPAAKAAISAVEAKRFSAISTENVAESFLAPAMGIVANTPRGWLALAAYQSCADDELAATIGSVLAYLPGYRGPRLATNTALRNAGLQLDDASAEIDFPGVHHPWMGNSNTGGGGYFATVAKITVKGDKATVAFKPKLAESETCMSRKQTNKISMITSSGSVIYESVCTSWKTFVVNRAPPTQEVGARYVEGLKPGMNVVIGGGMVMAAFEKGKRVPSFVAGVPVK
jgi:hypothetical protein